MSQRSRSVWYLCAGIFACCPAFLSGASAQAYPAKPARLIVGFAAGGGADTTARLLAQKLSEILGQRMIVENRVGAGGTIATELVATSPPDGYTLLLMAAADAIQPALRRDLRYDMERDLAPVSLVAIGPQLLTVNAAVPARSIKELIAVARSQPGKLSYGSSGVGGTAHLAGELFNQLTGVSIVHVPYKGAAESFIATAAGQISMNFGGITGALPFIDSGKIRPLAVTSLRRTSLMPAMPTLDESGLPGYDRSGWYGVLTPAGTPRSIVGQLNAGIDKVVGSADLKDAFRKQGLEEAGANTPEQFAALIQREIAENTKLIRSIGLKAE